MNNLKIYDDSTNYTATVIKLPPKQPVPGLYNLVQVEVFGNVCLIGKDSDPTVLYLYFPAGSQLGQKYLSANKLYRDVALNKYTASEEGQPQERGFFEPNGRVKGLKLKGVISTGFVIPLISLEYTLSYSEGGDSSSLEIGDEFNEWCGIEICRKYIPKNVRTPGAPGSKDKQAKVNNKLADLMIPNQFRFHVETTHLAKNLHKINHDDIIVITDKWHGSSCILSRVFVNRTLNKAQKLWNKYLPLPKFENRKLAYIYSSGKPKSNLPKGVEGAWINTGQDFYGTNIWKEALERYKHTIEDGITLYGELVGFTSGGAYIQNKYDYKCYPGTNRFIVYRITYTKPDGNFIEFSWQQIKDYCKKYDLEHVKEFIFGRADELFLKLMLKNLDVVPNDLSWQEKLFTHLQKEYNLEKICLENKNSVPAEGVVLRVDGHLNSYEAYKVKSRLFVLGESNADEVTLEDQQ